MQLSLSFDLLLLILAQVTVLSSSLSPKNGSQRNFLSQSDHLDTIKKSLYLFKNKTLIVSVVVREPFVIYNPPVEAKNSKEAIADLANYSGVAIEVLKRFRLIFKFNIKIIWPADNQFGVLRLLPQKYWTGLVGSLYRNESDIGVTALSITLSRAHAIDFTRAYFVETAAILLKVPEEVQNYMAIFEPFSMDVWCVLLVTILVLIVLVTVMTRLEDKQKKQEKVHELMKFLDKGPSMSTSSEEEPAENEKKFERRFSMGLSQKLKALQKAQHEHEFGTSLREQFYYAVTCVINILLIRGTYKLRRENNSHLIANLSN